MSAANDYDRKPMAKAKGKHADLFLRLVGVVKLGKAVLFLALGLALIRVLGNERTSDAIAAWLGHLRPSALTHLVDRLLRGALALNVRARFVLETGAFVYAAVFTVEGIGLLMLKRWAEWMTVVSTALLIPFEVYEIAHRPSAVRIGAFGVNVAILVYLVVRIRRDRKSGFVGEGG